MESTSRRITRRCVLQHLGLAGLLTTIAACSAPATPAAPTAAPAKAADAPAAKPAAAPTTSPATTPPAPTAAAVAPTAAPKPTTPPAPTQAPAKAQIAKIKMVQSSPGFAFAPIYVAREQKFFEDEAIDLDWQVVAGDPLATTAVQSGEVQFAGMSGHSLLLAVEKGFELSMVSATTVALTQELAARKDWMEKKGVTVKSPLADKLAALKGARIGVGTASGLPNWLVRYLVQSSGINPDTDVEFIVVGQAASRVAALRENRVDLFVGGVPDPEVAEQEGAGVVYLKMGDEVPIFRTFIDDGVTAKRDWLTQNAAVTERVCRALGRACNVLATDLPRSKASLKTSLPQTNPQALDLVLDQEAKIVFGADGRMSEDMWKNTVTVFKTSGAVKDVPTTAEGTMWSNKFLVNVAKR